MKAVNTTKAKLFFCYFEFITMLNPHLTFSSPASTKITIQYDPDIFEFFSCYHPILFQFLGRSTLEMRPSQGNDQPTACHHFPRMHR